MPAMGTRVNAWFRRDKLRVVLTVLLVALTGGIAMGIAAGTWRTDTAPDRYTEGGW